MSTENSAIGSIFGGTLLLAVVFWGVGAYFNIGFFSGPDSVDLFSKLLVGTLVIGFFLFILLDKTEPVMIID